MQCSIRAVVKEGKRLLTNQAVEVLVNTKQKLLVGIGQNENTPPEKIGHVCTCTVVCVSQLLRSLSKHSLHQGQHGIGRLSMQLS